MKIEYKLTEVECLLSFDKKEQKQLIRNKLLKKVGFQFGNGFFPKPDEIKEAKQFYNRKRKLSFWDEFIINEYGFSLSEQIKVAKNKFSIDILFVINNPKSKWDEKKEEREYPYSDFDYKRFRVLAKQ